MAHFAQVDSNNLVQQVMVISDTQKDNAQDFFVNVLGLTGTWIETSLNTTGGVFLSAAAYQRRGPGPLSGRTITVQAVTGTPLRYNTAQPGYTYDPVKDAFIPPQIYKGWLLNNKCLWEPPFLAPLDGNLYAWNENTTNWVYVSAASAIAALANYKSSLSGGTYYYGSSGIN